MPKHEYSKSDIEHLKRLADDFPFFYQTYINAKSPVDPIWWDCCFRQKRGLIEWTANPEIMHGYLLWNAMFKNFQTIAITAPPVKDAQQIISRMWDWYHEVPEKFRPEVVYKGRFGEFKLDNGARIIGRNNSTASFRGMSVGIMFLSEYRRYSDKVKQGLMNAYWPVMATTMFGQFIFDNRNNKGWRG